MGGVYTHARGVYGSVWRKGLRRGLMNLGRETFFGMMKITSPNPSFEKEGDGPIPPLAKGRLGGVII